ncbi:MAG: hypothetical protein LBB19_03090 [Puniceicoccales bacterium]|jgi:hypothetical protein|nr:hypothetical protein [Puniceicoccales bacterium]
MPISVNNPASPSISESTSSTPASVGKDAAGRQITQSSQAQSGISRQVSGSSLADKIRVQNQRETQQGARSTISELNKNSQVEHMGQYEQASTQYDKKSALGKWASRVAGHFTETAHTQKKDARDKLQADIEGYFFKSSSSKRPQDLTEDKATLRQWQSAIENYSPKDQAKLIRSMFNKMNDPEIHDSLKKSFSEWMSRPEIAQNKELQKLLRSTAK